LDQAIWIVDGNNVIRRDSRLRSLYEKSGWDTASRALESELSRLRRRKGRGHSIVVVYDGVRGAGARDRSTKGLRVLYSGEGSNADRLVLEEAHRYEGRTRVHVISSDRKDIGSRLHGFRVHWLRVEDFVRDELRKHERRETARRASDAEDEKPAPPRGAEVERWLRIFGEEEGEEAEE